MKNIKKYITYWVFTCFVLLYGNAKAGVNGFTLTTNNTSSNPTSPDLAFPVNASFNWTPNTTNATLKISYNPALVDYMPTLNTLLPPCITVTDNNSIGVVTLTINNLAACANTGSLRIEIYFQFKCPETCTGVLKSSLFNAVLTDNLNTTQNASCTVFSKLNNGVQLTHTFQSFNQATGEIKFLVRFTNQKCFTVNNPKFNISLSLSIGATISPTVVSNTPNMSYTVVGNTILTNHSALNGNLDASFYYTVKIPCNMGLGQNFTSNITYLGDNCNIPNSIIAGPAAATYLIPANVLPNPNILTAKTSTSTYFRTSIYNNGNTPLNLTATHQLPLVHIKNAVASVMQTSTQTGLTGAIKYFNCSNTPTANFPLNGISSSDANAPTNTKKLEHSINNLLPGEWVNFDIFYDLTSSCNGPAGSAPYIDNVSIAYNCSAPPNSCIACGPGTPTPIVVINEYNPQPYIQCNYLGSQSISDVCKSVGDTVDICYGFKNIGDAPLVGGIYEIALPTWLQAIGSSISYTGFPTNPTLVSSSNLKFNLPTIPFGTTIYKVCFKAIILPGATGGETWINSKINSNTHDCKKKLAICSFSALGVDKKVKGNKDNSFSTSGNGEANSDVEYEITLKNTGTEPLKNLVVIDRIPAIGNQSILGSPNSTAINNQFDMKMVTVPANANFTVDYTPTRNMATGWPGTATVPAPIAGTWGAALNDGGVKFTFNPTFILAPGASHTFTFKTKIPAGTASGLVDCNTVGFIATPERQSNPINPAESNPVCLTVKDPPCGCSLTSKPSIFWQSGSNETYDKELVLTCGETLVDKLECFKPYLIRMKNPCGEDCSPDEIITKITYPNGSVVTSNNILGANLIANQVGIYSVSMKVKCNGKWCTECIVKFKQTKKCEPPCDNCKDKVKATFNKEKSSAIVAIHPASTTINASITLDGGADTYTEIRANIVDFNIFADKNCLEDYTTANNWGSVIGGTLNGFTSAITNYTGVSETNLNNNPREIVFKSVSPATSVNTNLNLTIKIPGVNPLSCCCINSTIFVKITYRNNKCEECFKIVKIDANQCPGTDKPATINFNPIEGSPQFRMQGINKIDSELIKSSSKKDLKK